MKHMEGLVPDTFGKIVQVFDRAIDETSSGLSLKDRTEVARFYLEYL
jgi:hypothetical protein